MLDTPLMDRAGRPIIGPDNEPATVRTALYAALDTQLPDDDKMDPATKLKLAKLSLKLADAKAALSAGETTTLLERAGRSMSVLVYGQLVQILDPKTLD